ncbi:hypothetical protein BC938DRAFT_480212 [Jimgerdemannia flammicorona]|uniref:Uncharacterized protein n=1 Tax=Jimgerdemannia flammicorona TaxID=994334 RepID=A0A433QXF3_9FUNG|nr:hypothetical protein BC938DRAFT_480212 [Jimgerdemannia flammicorona]
MPAKTLTLSKVSDRPTCGVATTSADQSQTMKNADTKHFITPNNRKVYGVLNYFAMVFAVMSTQVASVVAQDTLSIQYRSVVDPISAAFTVLVINSWNTASYLIHDNTAEKIGGMTFIIGAPEFICLYLTRRIYAFFRLRKAGLAQYQAALIVRGQLILAHSTEEGKIEKLQYSEDIESRHIVDGKTLGRVDFVEYVDVSWLLQKRELVPTEIVIKAQSASSTIGPVIALVQAGWSLINGVERLVHRQALSGLDAIGLQYSMLSILIAAEAIFIPNIGHDFVHIVNETKQESLDHNVSIGGSESILMHFILPWTIYALGAALQTQVDFPSYAIWLAVMVLYALRIVTITISSIQLFTKNFHCTITPISVILNTCITIAWIVLCSIGIARPEILVKTDLAFNWPHL